VVLGITGTRSIEQSSQLVHRHSRSRFHGADWDIENRCDLLGCSAIEVSQLEYRALRLRKLGQRGSNLHEFWLGRQVHGIIDQGALENGSNASDSESVEGATASLQSKPAPDRSSLWIKAAGVHPDLQEKVMNEILGVRR
jgi:hypothetical protein